jgi:hypothetical protein
MTTKECGTCTKCCEGYLSANIRGHEMYKGKPCIFVEIGKGCKEYDKRPLNPCKTFSCGWKIIEGMPDEFKPETSGVIFTWRTTEKNLQYLQMHRAPNNPSPQVLTWVFIYAIQNAINFLWDVDDKCYYFGNDAFCYEMKLIYG